MALTKAQVREILSTAGVDAERIASVTDQIIQGHTASIEALREERDTWKTEAGKVASLEKEKTDLEEKLKKFDGKKSYADLEKEYEDYKNGIAQKEVRGKQEKAYTKILKDAGIAEKHWPNIIKYSSDVDSVELDENGEAKNANDLLTSVKNEWSNLIPTKKTTGAATPTPPEGNGESGVDTSNAKARVERFMAERYGTATTTKKED